MSSKERARALRRQSTWAEKLMWRWLRDRRFSCYKFRRQTPIGPYFIDFYCAAAKLAVELDGREHGTPDQQAYDEARGDFLAKFGIRTLRFWNSQLSREPDVVRNTLWEVLQERLPQIAPDYTRPLTEAERK